jgi:hypothetical protein
MALAAGPITGGGSTGSGSGPLPGFDDGILPLLFGLPVAMGGLLLLVVAARRRSRRWDDLPPGGAVLAGAAAAAPAAPVANTAPALQASSAPAAPSVIPAAAAAAVVADAALDDELAPVDEDAPLTTSRKPRKAMPTMAASAAAAVARTFDRPAPKGVERAKVGYRRVRISSEPDAVRSTELGRLDRGDEVEILESHEGFLQVRTPDNITGWILRHTIVGAPST